MTSLAKKKNRYEIVVLISATRVRHKIGKTNEKNELILLCL
jgi:hypothetical protein